MLDKNLSTAEKMLTFLNPCFDSPSVCSTTTSKLPQIDNIKKRSTCGGALSILHDMAKFKLTRQVIIMQMHD